MDTNTIPRIERHTREALGESNVPPEKKAQADADEDRAKWERLRGILASLVLSVFAIGLWALGIFAALRPIV